MQTENSSSSDKAYSDDAISEQKKTVGFLLVLDLISFLPFLYIGISSGSLLLFSDAIDYIKSIATGLIAWNILQRIQNGKFREFDYGYGKIESLGGIAGSVLFLIGLMILSGFSLQRIISPAGIDFDFVGIGAFLQLFGVVIYGWLWIKNKKLAERINSPLISMQWRINRADTLTCFSVLIVLVMNMCLRSYSWAVYIDPVSNLILVVYLAWTFIPSISHGMKDLMDKTLEEDLQLKILKTLANYYDEYEDFHDVKSRRAGNRIFIDVILSFNPDKKMREVSGSINRLKSSIENDIPQSNVNIILHTEESIEPAHQPVELI